MSATAAKTRITSVGTIGIPVTDQDRALEFYIEKLGFETRLDAAFGEGQRWIEVAPPGSATTIALAQAREGFPAGVDTGLRLSTPDAEGDHVALRERGVDVDPELLLYPVPMFTFRDLDRNRLYVVQRPPDR